MIGYPLRPTPYPEIDTVGIRLGKAGRIAWVSLVSTVAFVPVQRQASIGGRNRYPLVYVKTHPCVVYVPCRVKACRARTGDLCKGRDGSPTVGCHVDRKDDFYTLQKTRRG